VDPTTFSRFQAHHAHKKRTGLFTTAQSAHKKRFTSSIAQTRIASQNHTHYTCIGFEKQRNPLAELPGAASESLHTMAIRHEQGTDTTLDSHCRQ
jgi:hypothetical protein